MTHDERTTVLMSAKCSEPTHDSGGSYQIECFDCLAAAFAEVRREAIAECVAVAQRSVTLFENTGPLTDAGFNCKRMAEDIRDEIRRL